MLVEALMKEEEELKTMLVEALKKEEEQKLNVMLVAALQKSEREMSKQWLEQGEAIGESRAELKRNRQIARNMAANNYPGAIIADLLGISEVDVQRLLSDEQPN